MSVASRIQEIETHIGDIYDTLEVGGTDLTDLNKNIVNINSSLKDRYKYFLNNGVEVIWNNWEKVIGEGTEFTLENTIQAPMKINLKGNTKQEGTPTPDYPQDIQVVSGDNTIEVVGKNLLYNQRLPITQADTNITYNNGIFGLNGTASISSNAYIIDYNTSLIHLEVGESLTYYIERVSGTSKVAFLTYFTPDDGSAIEYTWGVTLAENTNSNKVVKTATKSGKVDHVQFFLTNGAVYNSEVKILVQKGNIANPTFIPYQSASYPINLGDIELCKIADYQDYFYKDNGKWYLHKEISKVVYDGTETNWNRFEIGSSIIQYYRDLNTKHNTNIPLAKSNYFRSGVLSHRGAGYENSVYTYSGGIAFNPNSFPTLEDWKTWLSTHNTEVYYVLATPTTTEITDTTLLSQLEAIKYSYDDQTNISQVNNDMPFKLDVTALKNI